MADLPTPGGDANAWAEKLNSWLLVAHDADGGLRQDTVGSEQLAEDAELATQAQVDSLRAGTLQTWQPITLYTEGAYVLSPAGQIVEANAAFTSGVDYDAADWTIVASGVTFGTTAGTAAEGDDARITGAAQKAENLADLDDTAEALTNLGAAPTASPAFTGTVTINGTQIGFAAPGSVPPGTALENAWEPGLSRYNWTPENTRKIRAGLGKAAAVSGATALSRWLWIGDSKMAGLGLTDLNQAPPQVVAGELNRLTGAALAGYHSSGSATDARWVWGAGWTGSFGRRDWNTTAAAATFTSDVTGGKVDIHYFNTSGAFTYDIQNAAGSSLATAVVTPTGAQSIAKVSLTIANIKKVVITPTGGAVGYLIGVDVYPTTGLYMINRAYSGTDTGTGSSTGWTSTNYAANLPMATAVSGTTGVDAVFISLGVNDEGHSRSTTQFATSLDSLVTSCKALTGAPNVVLLAQVGSGPLANDTWKTYTAVVFAVADAQDIPVISFADAIGPGLTAYANGMLQGDQIHETAAGCAAEGHLIAAGIA